MNFFLFFFFVPTRAKNKNGIFLFKRLALYVQCIFIPFTIRAIVIATAMFIFIHSLRFNIDTKKFSNSQICSQNRFFSSSSLRLFPVMFALTTSFRLYRYSLQFNTNNMVFKCTPRDYLQQSQNQCLPITTKKKKLKRVTKSLCGRTFWTMHSLSTLAYGMNWTQHHMDCSSFILLFYKVIDNKYYFYTEFICSPFHWRAIRLHFGFSLRPPLFGWRCTFFQLHQNCINFFFRIGCKLLE